MALEDARAVLTDRQLKYKVYYLVSFWLESLLYGIYVCLFVAALNIMLRKRTWDYFASKVFLAGTVSLFVLISLHNVMNVYTMITAYAYEVDPVGSINFIRNLDNWDAYAFPVILAIVVWLADILVIYRCYLVWDRNRLVVSVPILLLLASIGTHSINLWWFGHRTARTIDQMRPILNTTFPLHFAQNVLTTGLIAYRIWSQHKRTQRANRDLTGDVQLVAVMRIVIESAFVYTMEMLLAIVMFATGHPAEVIVQRALLPTVGIVFGLVAIRAHSTRVKHRPTVSNSIIPSWIHGEEGEEADTSRYAQHRRVSLSTRSMPIITTVVEEHRMDDFMSTRVSSPMAPGAVKGMELNVNGYGYGLDGHPYGGERDRKVNPDAAV